MKNWSESDSVFPVEFDFPVENPVGTKNRSRFFGTLETLAMGLLILVMIGFGAIGLAAVLGMVGMLIYSWYIAMITTPLITAPLTIIVIGIYTACCLWVAADRNKTHG